MAFEVSKELVIVCGEVTDCVIDLRAGVQNRLGMVGESGEMSSILLGEQCLYMLSFFSVIKLQGVV